MPLPVSLIRSIRSIHLYMGLFIAPAVLFFAFTGALQTFSLHETTKGSDYKPAQWMVVLGELHKKQTIDVPVRRAPPVPAAKAGYTFSTLGSPPEQKKQNLLPMKIYFVIVATGLAVSTFTGIYMAYKFTRNKIAITATLCVGAIIPALLLSI